MLPYAEGASWDPQLTCLPGTRLSTLATLDTWAHRAGSDRIFWLKGVAGSGKTAVLHTIAKGLKDEGLLGSAFFFSRDTVTRNTPKSLFTTIARDIANLHPGAAEDIADALEAEPALASASVSPIRRAYCGTFSSPSRRSTSSLGNRCAGREHQPRLRHGVAHHTSRQGNPTPSPSSDSRHLTPDEHHRGAPIWSRSRHDAFD